MPEKYDPRLDLAKLVDAARYSRHDAAVYGERVAEGLGLAGDASVEEVAVKLERALGLGGAPGSLRDPARVRVTVTDLDTGDSEAEVIADDYFMTCAGSCYVDHVQVYANGTHVITVKGRARRAGVPGEVAGNA
jgi:hypothetical protein